MKQVSALLSQRRLRRSKGSLSGGAPAQPSGEGRRAFTLMELLVVIAIIAILASLLLPALSGAKRQGQSLACLNNLKQLLVCWHLYTTDNNDVLPPNNSVYNVNNPGQQMIKGASWCLGITRTDTTTTNIENGMLFPYNQSVGIYHCPADHSTIEDSNGNPLPQLRTRSYNLCQAVNGWPEFDWGMNHYMPSFKKFSQIMNPSTARLIVFLDVHEDEIFDSHFGIPTPAYTPNPNNWWDIPANRHNQGANLGFADSHAERWRWKVPKVFRRPAQQVPPEEKPDYQRVQDGVRQSWD